MNGTEVHDWESYDGGCHYKFICKKCKTLTHSQHQDTLCR